MCTIAGGLRQVRSGFSDRTIGIRRAAFERLLMFGPRKYSRLENTRYLRVLLPVVKIGLILTYGKMQPYRSKETNSINI